MTPSNRIAWITFILFSVASLAFSFKYFSEGFPVININIAMNRAEAIEQAQHLATKYDWNGTNFKTAASFDSDNETQTYVELEAGGKPAFIQMINGTLYAPYHWHVRLFKPHEPQETAVYFTPQGKPYGFTQTLSENTATEHNTDTNHARTIAEQAATNEWLINLHEYNLIESSQKVQPSKRVDHTFVYERTKEKIGNATYRLKLVVSGDKLTALNHFVKVPETFLSRFREMRSSNNNIAFFANILMFFLYILGGCLGGLFLLTRRNTVMWRIPALLGFGVGFLQFLNYINQLPVYWMHYNTVNSPTTFLLQLILGFAFQFAFLSTLICVCAAAAESLTRTIFDKQLLLWNLWKTPLNHSYALLGRTASAYLIIPFFIAFQIIFQKITGYYLGWWTPASPQTDPNMLSTYAPWLFSVANSVQAGFWEECLFRAVPLAGAALLGKYFNKERLFLGIGFIAQIFIFGAAHANYPNFPAYARIIELIIPSAMFGFIYLRYGLFTGILTHYLYDVLLFSLPIFASSFADSWFSQITVIALSAIPLLIIAIARFKAGAWANITPENLNGSWQPAVTASVAPSFIETTQPHQHLSSRIGKVLLIASTIGLIGWFLYTPLRDNSSPITNTREQAITAATEFLTQRRISLEKPWQTLAYLQGAQNLSDRYVWQECNRPTFELLRNNHYLSEPSWRVRFVRFSGTIDERMEEFSIFIDGNNNPIAFTHTLPESQEGKQLDQAQARTIAMQELKTVFNLNEQDITEIDAQAKQLDNRRDWTFTFKNNQIYPHDKGSARINIKISGDSLALFEQYFHVPEEWQRTEQQKDTTKNIIQALCALLIGIISMLGVGIALMRWSQRKLRIKPLLYCFILFAVLTILHLINVFPTVIALFNTTEPYQHQFIQAIISNITQLLILQAALLSLTLALAYNYKRNCEFAGNQIHLFASGIMLGVFNAGILSLVKYFKPVLHPIWADYSALFTTWPLFGFIRNSFLSSCSSVVTFLLFFIAIDAFTQSGTKRRAAGIGAIMLFGFALAGADELTSLYFWPIYGLAIGILFTLEYFLLFRRDISLVPLMMIGMMSMKFVQQMFFCAIPGILLAVPLTITVIIASAWYWFKAIRSEQA